MPRAARDLRNRRLNRSRRIAQALVLGAGGVAGTGVGMMAHAASHAATSTTIPSGGGTTTSVPHATTTVPHSTTTTHAGHPGTTVPATTTTVWTPPVTTPHTTTTQCYTNASGQFIGCW